MKRFGIAILTFLAYLLAAKVGSLIHAVSGYTPTIWPPAGIAVAGILLGGNLSAAAVLFAALIVNLDLSLPAEPALISALGSTFSALLAARAISKRKYFDWGFNRPNDVIYFLVTAVLMSPWISAIICALTLVNSNMLPLSEVSPFIYSFWIGDGLGILMVVPVFMIWANLPARKAVLARPFEFGALILVAVCLNSYLFVEFEAMTSLNSPIFRRIFILFPILMWGALRFGSLGLSTVMLVATALATYGATHEIWLSHAIEVPEGLYTAQLGIGISTMTGLIFAAVIGKTRANEERFRSIFERSGVPMGEADLRGKFVLVNDKFCKLTGYSRDELLKMRFPDITHPDDIEKEADLFKRLVSKQIPSMSVEKRYITKSGDLIWISVDATLIEHGPGTEPTAMGVVWDITNRKRAEAVAENAQRLAEDASQAKSDFLASMSHEIRTPLGVILGFSDLLKNQELPKETRSDFVETVHRNAQELGRLIDDILDLSKVEAGKIDVTHEEANLAEIFEDLRETFRPTLITKKINLATKIDQSVPTTFKTDRMRLRQILVNIIGNALKFTDKGSVTAHATIINERKLEIMISDTGCGIPKEDIPILFQPFRQSKRAKNNHTPGTGLGLVLSRRLAKLLGGDVTLERSKAGVGSVFKIVIQIDPSLEYQKASEQIENQSKSENEYDLNGTKILIAEDTPDQALLIKMILTSLGATVDVVENGADAVQKALSGNYSIVLMDMQMPILNGYEATAQLRKRGYQQPILALTAQAMKSDQVECKKIGCSGHVPKPFSPETLVSAISSALKSN